MCSAFSFFGCFWWLLMLRFWFFRLVMDSDRKLLIFGTFCLFLFGWWLLVRGRNVSRMLLKMGDLLSVSFLHVLWCYRLVEEPELGLGNHLVWGYFSSSTAHTIWAVFCLQRPSKKLSMFRFQHHNRPVFYFSDWTKDDVGPSWHQWGFISGGIFQTLGLPFFIRVKDQKLGLFWLMIEGPLLMGFLCYKVYLFICMLGLGSMLLGGKDKIPTMMIIISRRSMFSFCTAIPKACFGDPCVGWRGYAPLIM